MKLVTRDDIERWAERIDSKGDLPYLISRLVRATTPASTQANFPSGSAAYIGGWDGEVNCQEDNSYVPKGISLYEFGTEDNPKGKADKDYNKRKKDTLGYNPKECVFTFVTPRFWKFKNKWIEAKKAEGFWKDVKVYDSSDLEQWLDIALATARWFSGRVRSYPYDGIMTSDEFWEEYTTGPNGLILSPDVITAGREYEQKQLLTILQDKPSIKGVKASTKSEAIAFIIATAKKFPQNESDRFFSKSLIIDTEGNFRGIRINTITPLNLIPRFEETQPLYLAVSKGHHVIVPLGADDTFNQDTIILPTIDRDGQVQALIKSGVSEEDAEKFSKESGRNITILKRLLKFTNSRAKWIDDEDIREIIPALILGRWSENFIGDIELIEKLSEQKYSDYSVILNKWKNLEESPIIQIGETWRLTSPLDLWTTLSPNLTQKDLQNIQETFLLAFKGGNPVIEPKDDKDLITIFNKPKRYSSWSREGITQSLILVGRFGEGLNIPNLSNPQLWVDNIILNLLHNASGETWKSVNHELPLISEASPTGFLKATSNSLEKAQPEIMDMFKEEPGFLHSTSNHTGLLWALEGIAWLPEHLRESSLILLKLARFDPGGNLSNRPINSISEIFKPWHHQTLASYDERMEILKYITGKEPETGWELLIRMLPDRNGVGHPTHKMRWRMFDKKTNAAVTYQEIWNTHTYVIDLLLNLFDNSESKFSQLISEISNLSPNDRKKVLDWADSICVKVHQTKFTAWETIRNLLNRHKTFPDAKWGMPKADLDRLGSLYEKLKPTDVINKYIWLFNNHWPSIPEGFETKGDEFVETADQQQKRVDNARTQAAEAFLNELGLEKTLTLRKEIKEIWSLGDALARIVTKQKDILLICECLNDEREYLGFIRSFIFRKSIIKGFEWIKRLVKDLQKKKFDKTSLANVVIPLNQSKEIWDFVSSLTNETKDEYWQNMNPNFYTLSLEERIIGVKMLIKHKRFFSAIYACYHFSDTLPTNILVDLLKKAVTEKSSEKINFNDYYVERIFETLDKRDDLEKSELLKLEWLYLPFLDSHGTSRNPKTLEDELANSPEFFIEVLKLVYKPKNKEQLEAEIEGISEEVIQNRSRHGYQLLRSWKKIPGMEADKSIDEVKLEAWIEKVRELATASDRLDVADIHIGQVLGQYPEDIPQWPQEKIFKIIEEINTDSLKRNYSSALFNKRSFSSRGPFDGGDIEREKATYFGKLATNFKNKFPNVAEIFKNLELAYLEDAKRMDESAERDRLDY
jgi:hypothetical protein